MATSKEKIIPPSPKNVRQAGKNLGKGGPSTGPDGRVLVERKVALKQHVKRGGK